MTDKQPVAWMHISAVGNVYFRKKPQDAVFNPQPLYTAPPQREWQGITDENIFAVLENLQEMYNRPPTTDSRVIFARAIEAKLKEKNT